MFVSCVVRSLVMGGRVAEELEAVAAVFGPGTISAGYYCNGEISPFGPGTGCKLHNQTMTVSHFFETA